MENIRHLCLSLLVISSFIFPQQLNHGGFISPGIQFTSINGQQCLFAGAQAMWVLHNHFAIGGAIYGLTDRVTLPISSTNGDPYTLNMSYGGLQFAYLVYPVKNLTISAAILCAGGDIKFTAPKNGLQNPDYYPSELLVWQPQLSAGYKISPYFTIWGSAGYRFITQFDTYYLTRNDLKGFSASLSFSFGKFSSL
jgi:hypothetical protein